MFIVELPDSKLRLAAYVGDGFDGASHWSLQEYRSWGKGKTADSGWCTYRKDVFHHSLSKADRMILAVGLLRWVNEEMALHRREGEMFGKHTSSLPIFSDEKNIRQGVYQTQYVVGLLEGMEGN